eukprot:TRINITY_DN6130_c0_g1_i1.p1 TRINITY_DN6130_c0_g1~~TRINITY_DN6130_c0_g1_i1.p1  ORF type:complete len:1010 (+),score=322.58 TRINITY_DN6130_c0_g1_i1:280-3030(+)
MVTSESSDVRNIHLFYGEEKGKRPHERHCRFFARAMIRKASYSSDISDIENVIQEAENVLGEACNALELASADPRYSNAWDNHIFMKFVGDLQFKADDVFPVITALSAKYEKRLGSLKIGTVEVVGQLRGQSLPARFIISNPTQYHFNVDAYLEVKDPSRNIKLASVFGSRELDGMDTSEPHPVPNEAAKKRRMAHANTTTYVYDYLALFEVALNKYWETYLPDKKSVDFPRTVVTAKELVLNSQGNLEETSRPMSKNDVGMVAWMLTLYTPEYPKGRNIVLIANDITFQIGSFGVKEDIVFHKASELARQLGLPRIYIAANSGARIGLAEEVRDKFRVVWNDENHPEKGFKYLYVNKKDYEELSKTGSIQAKKVSEDVYMISDIIGMEDGLGVENLRGSGMIAGETSRAYNEIFTLTVVTGRTVGIGAYLVRLGQRTIQSKAPIILTGASALNKVLGRNVYSSNAQLGGTQIMYSNGVSHLISENDLESIQHVIQWLGYIPCKQGAPLPVLETKDPIDRDIGFTPSKSSYDPRHMLAGQLENGVFKSGFFDTGSFTETLGGWGKTVVVGRARLGGIPVGIISVETRSVQQVTPADPAVEDSREIVKTQAGQVWAPDSAFKTAQGIKDFAQENLPIFIFANWRGFSGGMTDLFDEILKFGAEIVDNLRTYTRPIFIYIPPFGELRGGAWVVVDPTINLEQMEMYADDNARGGVLEPSGILEIKYKLKDILATMHRLDPKLIELDRKQKTEEVSKEISRRESELLSVYGQVANNFADLHDTPGRMKSKGVIRDVIPWKTSRRFFYHRLVRRISEEILKERIAEISEKTRTESGEILSQWIRDSGVNVSDDKAVGAWLTGDMSSRMDVLKKTVLREKAAEIARQDPASAVDGLLQVLAQMTPEQRAKILTPEKLKAIQ